MDIRALLMGLGLRPDVVLGLHLGADDRRRRAAADGACAAVPDLGPDRHRHRPCAAAKLAPDAARNGARQWFSDSARTRSISASTSSPCRRSRPSLAAIIASTMPLLVALGGLAGVRRKGAAAGRCRPGHRACSASALIMGSRITGGVDSFGLTLCVVGVVSLTVATMAVRGASSGGNLLMIVGLQMLIGSASLGVVALGDRKLGRQLDLAAGPRLRLHHAGPGSCRHLGLVPAGQPDRRGARRDLPLPDSVLWRQHRGAAAGRGIGPARRARRRHYHVGHSCGAAVKAASPRAATEQLAHARS